MTLNGNHSLCHFSRNPVFIVHRVPDGLSISLNGSRIKRVPGFINQCGLCPQPKGMRTVGRRSVAAEYLLPHAPRRHSREGGNPENAYSRACRHPGFPPSRERRWGLGSSQSIPAGRPGNLLAMTGVWPVRRERLLFSSGNACHERPKQRADVIGMQQAIRRHAFAPAGPGAAALRRIR